MGPRLRSRSAVPRPRAVSARVAPNTFVMIASLHHVASRARRSALLRPLEPIFRNLEPVWNRVLGKAMASDGLEARINDDVFRLSYQYGSRYGKQKSYEPDIYLPYATSIREGMTVLDIGAHVGFFALAAAKRVGPGGKVVAFEPSPATLRVLRHHVTLNEWDDRISVEASVVSDHAGSVTFYTFDDSMAASLSKENVEVLNVQRPGRATPVEVPAVTLDEYCRARGLTPNVIKIDVEGAELRVLKGAERVLRESNDLVIWCEVHPRQMENLGDQVSELEPFLDGLGYSISPIAEAGHHGIYPGKISRRIISAAEAMLPSASSGDTRADKV
jgi:FkbM family methyltransferase